MTTFAAITECAAKRLRNTSIDVGAVSDAAMRALLLGERQRLDA